MNLTTEEKMRLLTCFCQILLVLLLLAMVGCARTARIYNLDTGQVLNATFEDYGTGHGKITVAALDGNQLTGEYTTISNLGFSTGYAVAHASGTGGYAWVTAQGFSFNQPGVHYGSAVLAGEGLVIEIVYAVDSWTSHGHGVGRDNRGGKYRVQF